MKEVNVVLLGVGAVGGLIAKFLLEKRGVKIVGAVDVAADKVGRDLGEVIGLDWKLGVMVSRDVDSVLSKVKAEVAIHATTSYLKDTYPQIAQLIKNNVNVISTCEELSYPYYSEPKLAEKLDKLAKEHGVTVLGAGINPGFLMDTLVITLTAVCHKIEKIEAVRVINAATRRLPFKKKIGAGLSVEEFRQKILKKQITGHVGLEQSIAMIADALSWKLDSIKTDAVEPVIAEEFVEDDAVNVEAGKVAGIKQAAKGFVNGKEVICLSFQAYLGAKEEYDAITIKGVPTVNQKIQPCVHGDIGTGAIVVNLIPKVINAPAGLLTVKDLPVPSAVLGDLSQKVSLRSKSISQRKC
ncbi:MAG: hypothetical protein RMJ15_05750 [Nitrososphaerota archaeon]|nr:hypothetical protein [Candidatus Bathyarchaeota archaeon]MDW8023220.1 hypothetical protein [Nitrososphaerota archaeon]